MKSNKSNLDLSQKLTLFQGMNLIQDGLGFIEWTPLPNDASHEALLLLENRFGVFKDCIFDGNEYAHLIIDKIDKQNQNLRVDYPTKREIEQRLEKLREKLRKNK